MYNELFRNNRFSSSACNVVQGMRNNNNNISLFCGVCFNVTSRYGLGCWHRRSNFQCTEHLQVCLCVHTFFDARIWKCFMTRTAPFLYLCFLATNRCQMGVILVEIHPGILLHRFFFTFTSPYIWPSKILQQAQLLVFAWSIQLFCDNLFLFSYF